MKNLHLLSTKEKEELAYLKAKLGLDEPEVGRQLRQGSSRQTNHRPQTPSRLRQQAKPAKAKSSALGCWIKGFFLGLLLLLVGMGVMFFKGLSDIQQDTATYSPAVTEYFAGETTTDGVNILILGSDQRITENSVEARTDTIMVMNVGNSSGTIKLASFMRDTLVTIDGYSSYPGAYDYKLNTAFTLGEQEGQMGAEMVRRTLKENFDISISYYAMIDFETFALAVDTLFPNGVAIDAQFSTVEGEVVESVDVPDDVGENLSTGLYQTIAVGPQRMDGKTLLNYARFRDDDEGDSGRVRRQQEAIQAILSQVKDPTKLFTGSEALGKIYALTSTNVSFPFILTNGLSSLLASQKGMERLTIPAQGDWIDGYDMYGGLGILIDFESYKAQLAELGLR